MSSSSGDARVQEIRARHHGDRISTEASAPEYCPQCIVRWPCELGVLLARLDALTAERDRLRLGMESWRTAAQSNLQAHPADVQRLTDERDALAARLAAAEAANARAADRIMQDALDLAPDDPEHPDTICISYDALVVVLDNALRGADAPLAGSREQAASEGE